MWKLLCGIVNGQVLAETSTVWEGTEAGDFNQKIITWFPLLYREPK